MRRIPTEHSGVPLLLIAAIVGTFGLIVTTLILLVIVGFVLRRRKRRMIMVWSTLPTEDSSDTFSQTNGYNRLAAINPRVYTAAITHDSAATTTTEGTPSLESGQSLTPEPCKKPVTEDMMAAVLEISITPNSAIPRDGSVNGSPAHMCCHMEEQSSSIPTLSATTTADNEVQSDSAETEHIYSAVQRIGAPAVPPKSSDLN